MEIKSGEVEKAVKFIITRYLSEGEIKDSEFEYIKIHSKYLKDYKFVKK